MTLRDIASSRKKYVPQADKGINWLVVGGAVLIIFILVLGAIVYVAMNIKWGGNATGVITPPAGNNGTVVNGSVRQNQTCDDICLLNKALETKSIADCQKITNPGRLQECYERLSATSFDACLKVADEVKKTECVIANAVLQNSTLICGNIANESVRNGCIIKVDPCYFKTSVDKSTCLAIRDNNYALCAWNENCILDFVEAKGDETPCRYFNLSSKYTACIGVAVGGDTCKAMQYQSERDQCYAIYAVWTNESAYCYDISEETVYRQQCFQRIAYMEKNVHYCDKVGLTHRWDCYANYSIESRDVSGCTAIDKNVWMSKSRCFIDYAMIDRDPGACSLMEGDIGSRVNCYYTSIYMPNASPIPPENCKGIIISSWKDRCYSTSAAQNNDVRICNLIVDKSVFANCVAKFA